MDIGVSFPTMAIGTEPATIGEFGRRADELGFEHLNMADHVLGANGNRAGGWNGPYDHEDPFHEPLTVFSYLAGLTEQITFNTSIMILPQRQTALVAKQAAEVDLLAHGRLRLGMAVGWNPIEFVGLGQDFATRGARIEEQFNLLRKLWTNDVVDFDGDFHTIPDAGINPPPVQQPIPLWMGGTAKIVLDRVARLADGWLPQAQPGAELDEQLDFIAARATEAGRDIDDIAINGRIGVDPTDVESIIPQIEAWEAVDVEYLTIHTGGDELDASGHIDLLDAVSNTLDAAGISKQ